MELFERTYPPYQPLAERLRPDKWDYVVQVPSRIKSIKQRLSTNQRALPSLLLWGPPGVGKTTVMRLLAEMTSYHVITTSAVVESMREVRSKMEEALTQHSTIVLLVDEIHRFNKAQQDAFLSAVETGQVILLGATTENPWSYLTRALLSRLEVIRFLPLAEEELLPILHRASGEVQLTLSAEAEKLLLSVSHGDARELLKRVEALSQSLGVREQEVSVDVVSTALADSELLKRSLSNEDDRSAVVSAFIKSLRGSSPDGALYWAFRLLAMGEDPRFLMRRMIIFASEDIGNADPRALQMAIACAEGYDRVGEPEGRIILSHCVCYLAAMPKSNASYQAYRRAEELVTEHPDLPVPRPFHPGSTHYRNPHATPAAFVDEDYLPATIRGEKLYKPTENGFEQKIKERLDKLWR